MSPSLMTDPYAFAPRHRLGIEGLNRLEIETSDLGDIADGIPIAAFPAGPASPPPEAGGAASARSPCAPCPRMKPRQQAAGGRCCSLCCEEESKQLNHYVKLFRNGRNQAVRIPGEFELTGEDAVIRRDGARLTVEAAPAKSLLAPLAGWSPIPEEFPEIDDAAPEPVVI